MYKRILVALDSSETSRLALRHAIGLAKESGARLRLVSVVDEVALEVDSPYQLEIWQARVKAAKALLHECEDIAAASALQAESHVIEMEGMGQRIAELVVEDAKRWSADLLVIGTHGRRGLSHLLLGSVAEGVIRISPVPVLLVRAAG